MSPFILIEELNIEIDGLYDFYCILFCFDLIFIYCVIVLFPPTSSPLQGSMIPKPRFLQKRINEVAIGTFKEIATVQESASVYDALTIFVERRVSALPVVNEQGSPTSH